MQSSNGHYSMHQQVPMVFLLLLVNGWQLAKMKKEYSWHVPAIKFIGMKQLVSKVTNIAYLKNYEICENGKFGAISENLIFCQ